MNERTVGTAASIQYALDALRGARLDWARDDDIYATLGVAMRTLQRAEKKALKKTQPATAKETR